MPHVHMQVARSAGSSLMQPLDKQAGEGFTTAHLGSAAFAALAESSIAPENIFFHKFYQVSFCITSALVSLTPSWPCHLSFVKLVSLVQEVLLEELVN